MTVFQKQVKGKHPPPTRIITLPPPLESSNCAFMTELGFKSKGLIRRY
jgi:hypothetical protein